MADCNDGCKVELDLDQMGNIYDMFNAKVRADLDVDFNENKINGATYADTWSKLMSPLITGVLNSMVSLSTKETAADRVIKAAQAAKINYEVSDILPANKAQIIRQTEGFDDNLRQKLFDSQMNSWSMMYSSGLLEDKPSIISNDEVSGLYNSIKNEVEQYLGHWDKEISVVSTPGATPTDDVTMVFSWGTVIPNDNAGSSITYEIEVLSSEDGMLTGYPLITPANASTVDIIITPSEKYDITISANINAKDENGVTSFSSVTKKITKVEP